MAKDSTKQPAKSITKSTAKAVKTTNAASQKLFRSPYQQAANILLDTWKRHVSLKTAIYQKDGTLICNKTVYAIVCNCLKYQSALETVVRAVHKKEQQHDGKQALLHVLLYELLYSPHKRIVFGGGALKRAVLEKEAAYRQAAKNAPKTADNAAVTTGAGQTSSEPLRYVRVNTALHSTTTSRAIAKELQKRNIVFYKDVHVPDLFVLQLKDTAAVLDLGNQVVLQTKSSCFSALCLAEFCNNEEGYNDDVLDACAAPGNKTSHLAALLMPSQPRQSIKCTKATTAIYACERDPVRFEMLQERMKQLVPESSHRRIVVQHADFLSKTPGDFPTVKGVLLDPSCSGSGMNQQQASAKNVASLANFQKRIVKHAMSFPNVHTIVYSTCSVHEEENEQVIVSVLDEDHDDSWCVVAPDCLKAWPRRGLTTVAGLTHQQASCMIRVDGTQDQTTGFFVCVLRRREKQQQQPVLQSTNLGLHQIMADWKAFDEILDYNGQFAPQGVEKESPERNDWSSGENNNDGDVTTEAKDSAKKISKKRAKKLEWKKRQRQDKLARTNPRSKK